MAFSKTAKNKYNSNATQKILYIKMPIGIKIVELSREPLSIAYGRKEKNTLLAKI